MGCNLAILVNPDIAGVGVRGAIYIQSLLSFIPAFYALKDRKVSTKELKAVEKQSTTILITAFSVLISAIVQAKTHGLDSFHTSIILNLSWMNNANTFIYFVLYIHHKTYPDDNTYPDHGSKDDPVPPRWSAWFHHVLKSFGIQTKEVHYDAEASRSTPTGE
jgi:hypothetical protein